LTGLTNSLYCFGMSYVLFAVYVLALMALMERGRRRKLLEAAIAASEPLPTNPATVTHFAKDGRRHLVIQRRTSRFPTYVGC